MQRKLYGNKIEPACKWCEIGTLSADGRAVHCPRKGVVPLYHHCRKFIYTPLKRDPLVRERTASFLPEDFSL